MWINHFFFSIFLKRISIIFIFWPCFKNSIDLQNTFKIIPLERLLIETDSPYLAPVPNRGKKNEPSFIKYTAEKLATIKDISYSEIVENTTDNFNNLFYKQ